MNQTFTKPTTISAVNLGYWPALEAVVFEVTAALEVAVLLVAVLLVAVLLVAVLLVAVLVLAPLFAFCFDELDPIATVFFGDAETAPSLSTTTIWNVFTPPGLSATLIDAAADAGTVLTRIPLR
jgi:hypothetical protein